MGFNTGLDRAPEVRAAFNVGCLFDIVTGHYVKGVHNENILNGGLAHFTCVAGRGNTFKTAIALFMLLRALQRINVAEGTFYDTEMSATLKRAENYCRELGIDFGTLVNDDRLAITDTTRYMGNVFYERLKTYLNDRYDKPNKDDMVETPFVGSDGKFIKILKPLLSLMDSLSQFKTDSVEAISNKAEIGESDRNVEALRDAHAKNQMVQELPIITARGSGYVIVTAHAGDELKMDQYAPSKQKLTFLKGDLKLKNVPEKVTFLTNNCWMSQKAAVMIHKDSKAPEFPRNKDDDLKGDTDLMAITVIQLRGKNGPTGIAFDVVISQSEGVKVGLTEFCYLRDYDRFGIGGNNQNYFLDLYPECNLSRTQIRRKLDEDEKLRRAMEITAEMCQMHNHWHQLPDTLLCTPAELYNDLKKMGYDWNRLLDTRGYWVPVGDDAKHKPFLSTMDLLEMRVGLYHPWWYGDLPKS